METAVLRLGLAGFTPGEVAAIREMAGKLRQPDWLCGTAEGADAWLVNAARCAGTHGPQVRVLSTDPSGRAMAIVIDTASRPVAFARAPTGPVPSGSHPVFTLSQPDSLVAVLRRLERELHPVKTCYWTAAHLIAHHATVGKALFELHAGDELLAVVDMKGDVAVSPTAAESAFDRAVWKHRARAAVKIPASFRKLPLAHLMWQYATRTRRDLLPERFRGGAIFFRRPPRVHAQLIGDLHLAIARELAIAPFSLAQLQKTLRADTQAVARALAALYFVGSITSNPDRSWRGSVRGSLWSQPAPLELPMQPPLRREAPPSTAPLL